MEPHRVVEAGHEHVVDRAERVWQQRGVEKGHV